MNGREYIAVFYYVSEHSYYKNGGRRGRNLHPSNDERKRVLHMTNSS